MMAGWISDAVCRLSDRLVRVQRQLAGALVLAATLFILLNVFTRAVGQALYWIDELAIYLMVWAFFIGATATIRTRDTIAVTLLQTMLKPRAADSLRRILDLVVLGFAALLVYWCWLWFDPILLARNGFDLTAFIRASFNFIYREPTNTLGIAKVWVWAVVPTSAILTFVHASANVLDRTGTGNRKDIADGRG